MNRVVSIVLFLTATMAVAPRGLVAGDFEFPYPVNRLGWVDGAGRLSLWVNGDWRVALGEGGEGGKGSEWLPLRFKFSSMQERVADGMLGAGWWVPLLESTVVQRSEHSVRMTTLGGQSMYLWVDPREEGAARTYRTRDYKWVGTVGNGGRFDVGGPDGWKFTYRDGRLVRVGTPEGKTLDWNYDANKRVRSIVGEGGRELLTVKAGENGLAERITVAGGSSFDFAHGQYPQVAVANGMTTIAGILPSVSRITEQLPDGKPGEDHRFDLKLDRENGGYKMDYSKKRGEKELEVEKFTWLAAEGLLGSDSESKYEAVATNGGKGIPKLVRKFSDGTQESYWWDPMKMAEYREDTVGKKTVRSYVGTPGSSFLKQRQLTVAIGNDQSATRYSYDEQGKLLRVVRGKNGQSQSGIFQYDSQGRNTGVVHEGEPLVKREFDTEGRLAVEEIVGVETRTFQYPNGGGVEKTIAPVIGKQITEIFDDAGKLIALKHSSGRVSDLSKRLVAKIEETPKKKTAIIEEQMAKIEGTDDPIRRGELVLQLAIILNDDTYGPSQPKEAVEIFERLLENPSIDDLVKARTHNWLVSLLLEYDKTGKERMENHLDNVLELKGEGLDVHRAKRLQGERSAAFRMMISLAETGNMAADREKWQQLLDHYGDSEDFRKQIKLAEANQKKRKALEYSNHCNYKK